MPQETVIWGYFAEGNRPLNNQVTIRAVGAVRTKFIVYKFENNQLERVQQNSLAPGPAINIQINWPWRIHNDGPSDRDAEGTAELQITWQ